jgi:hypothetical protein
MAREDRPATQLAGEEERIVHATWSRSGKNLILTVGRNWDDSQQVLLSPDQAVELGEFLRSGPDAP